MIGSAWRRTSSPAGVSPTAREPRERSLRRSPTIFSSAAICWLTADGT